MSVVTTVHATMQALVTTKLVTAAAPKAGPGVHVHNVRSTSSFSVCISYSLDLVFFPLRSACGKGMYGRDCMEHCDCKFDYCDARNGTCLCPEGWTGLRCDQGKFY